MRTLTSSPSKCCYSILGLDVNCFLQGRWVFTREDSNYGQNRRYRQLVLIFRGVCASLYVLRSRFITDVVSVQSIGLRVLLMTQSQGLRRLKFPQFDAIPVPLIPL
jgi:hypothetical protein